MKLSKKTIIFIIVALLVFSFSLIIYGQIIQNSARVNIGQAIENFIGRDTVAYRIINYPTSLHDYFVPNQTLDEWNRFKTAANTYLDEIEVVLACDLVAPSNVIYGNVTFNSLRVSWTDNSTTETKYQVWRRTEGSGIFNLIADNLPANTNTYLDNSVQEDVYYTYQIRVYKNDSCYLDAQSSQILTHLTPPDFTGCWGIGSGQVRCEWTPQSTKATYYTIIRCSGSTPIGTCLAQPETTSPNNNYYIDTSAGTTMWHYNVRARNARNYSRIQYEYPSYIGPRFAGTTSQTSNAVSVKHFFMAGTHNGNFDTSGDGNGMQEVDDYCNANKPAGANRGPYRGWIQPQTTDINHLLSPNTTYVWVNNTENKRASFVTNSQRTPAPQEWNTPITFYSGSYQYRTWTNLNSNADGAGGVNSPLNNCNNWSMASARGNTGLDDDYPTSYPLVNSRRWLGGEYSVCTPSIYIYCFEP